MHGRAENSQFEHGAKPSQRRLFFCRQRDTAPRTWQALHALARRFRFLPLVVSSSLSSSALLRGGWRSRPSEAVPYMVWLYAIELGVRDGAAGRTGAAASGDACFAVISLSRSLGVRARGCSGGGSLCATAAAPAAAGAAAAAVAAVAAAAASGMLRRWAVGVYQTFCQDEDSTASGTRVGGQDIQREQRQHDNPASAPHRTCPITPTEHVA